MRFVRPSSAALSLLLGLAPSIVLAQGPPAAPAPPAKDGAAPAAGASPAKGAAAPATPARPPAVAAQLEAPAPAARPQGRKKGGRKVKELARKLEGAVATYPGFRMLPDGTSRVFVQVSQKVEVTESKAEGRLVYRMKGAQAIQTNRFPLVTTFFATPVGKVQLIDQGGDLDMVIDLRLKSDVQYRVLDTDAGIVVQVDFPKIPPGAQSVATTPEAPATAPRRRRAMPAAEAPDENESY